MVLGWAGTWEAAFESERGGARILGRGTNGLRTYLLPGEVIRTPRVLLLPYAGRNEDDAMNLWRRYYVARVLPKEADGRPLVPFSTTCLCSDTDLPNSDGSISERDSTRRPSMEKIISEGIQNADDGARTRRKSGELSSLTLRAGEKRTAILWFLSRAQEGFSCREYRSIAEETTISYRRLCERRAPAASEHPPWCIPPCYRRDGAISPPASFSRSPRAGWRRGLRRHSDPCCTGGRAGCPPCACRTCA